MITRGIIEKIYDKDSVAVRLPLFDKAITSTKKTPTDQLGTASICVLPNCIPNVRVGDVVYVGFENNDRSKPVIIGYVYVDTEYSTRQGISAQSIDVLATASLPAETTIGNISSKSLATLIGARYNLQGQLDELSERIARLEGLLNSQSNTQLQQDNNSGGGGSSGTGQQQYVN